MGASWLMAVHSAARQRGWALGTSFGLWFGRRYVLFGRRQLLVECYDGWFGCRLASFLLDRETGTVLIARRRWPLVPVWLPVFWALSLPARLFVWAVDCLRPVGQALHQWAERVGWPEGRDRPHDQGR